MTLSRNAIGAAGAADICSWAQDVGVKTLLLDGCQVGDEGAIVVSKFLVVFSPLRCLSLRQNCIGDRGIVAVATALTRTSLLRKLDLSHNDGTAASAESLRAALLEQKGLTAFSFEGNEIGEGGASVLSRVLLGNNSLIKFTFRNSQQYGCFYMLERNYQQHEAANAAAVCFLACFRFRRRQSQLFALTRDVIERIAYYIWSTRFEEEWRVQSNFHYYSRSLQLEQSETPRSRALP